MLLQSSAEMEAEAARFVASLSPRARDATVIALSGELGAGKTAFVKGVAKALGIEEHVTSPTFVIMKIYTLEGQKFDRLIHIDAYRLKGAHHLKVLGWDELLADPKNLICIEWPEMAEGALPRSAIPIALRYSGEDERKIYYQGEGEEAAGLA